MFKLVGIIIVLSVLLIFTFQNTQSVDIVFWPWRLSMSKAILSLGAFLCGLILGFVIGYLRRK